MKQANLSKGLTYNLASGAAAAHHNITSVKMLPLTGCILTSQIRVES